MISNGLLCRHGDSMQFDHNSRGFEGSVQSKLILGQNKSSVVTASAVDHLADVKQPPDPFRYVLRPSLFERVTFAFMLVTVAPVRGLLVVVCLAFAWLFAAIATWGWPIMSEQPLGTWRRFLKGVVVLWARAAWFFAGMHWVTVKGTRVSSAVAPILVMAPHSSLVDTLAGAKCGFPGIVSVTENARIPVIGTLFRVSESIFVTRSEAESRQRAMKEILRRARATETGGVSWPQLIIFPEGTCTNRTCLLPFKSGAFAAGVPIQPVCIRYPVELDILSWINIGPGLLAMFILLLCHPHTTMEMEYLPTYYPSDLEKKDAKLFAENVRQLISKHMKLPCTHHTYEDLSRLQKASKPDRSVLTALVCLLRDGFISMPPCPPVSKDE